VKSPLTIDGVDIFKNFDKKMQKIGKLPKSMSLRCDQHGSNTFLAIYNDDTDEIIDEVLDRCRIDDNLISNTDYNRDLCLNNSLVGSNGMKCLTYETNETDHGSDKSFRLVDSKNNIIYSNDVLNKYQPSSFYLEDNTGNFMTTIGDQSLVLLNINHPKVEMTCNNANEIVINTRDETKELIWKYRPNTDVCTNGLETNKQNRQNVDCSKIYKLETMNGFDISKTALGAYYNDNILELSIENKGIVKYNGKYELFRDEWNFNRNYNYAINCNQDQHSTCKFINLFTHEVVKELNGNTSQIQTTFSSNSKNEEDSKFKIGQKIMCQSGDYGLILGSEGFVYRSTENNQKMETLFKGDTDYYVSEYKSVVDASFDENYNFIINYSYGDPIVLVNYINNFKNNNSSKKDVRISCNNDNGRIEFYEVYNNEKKVYYEYPKPKFITTVSTEYSTSYSTQYSTVYSTKTINSLVTTTKRSYETYAYVSYYGTTGSKYLLGVKDLKEYKLLKANYGGILSKNASKYIRWLVNSIKDTPSKMYLANQNGGLSNYCLDVGEHTTSDSYYLSITKCANAKYLFKYYQVPFTDANGLKITKSPIIAVYKNANTLFKNNKGIPYCIYYSETLYLKECKFTKNYPNYAWGTVVQATTSHTHTTTKTEKRTITRNITYTDVQTSVVTYMKPTVRTTVIPVTATKASFKTTSGF